MLKRTKGRFLLTVLVITGLAGTIKNTTLSTQERKFAITDLKATRAELFNSIKGLSEKQLNFKPAADRWSIKECVFHIALAEKVLWQSLDASLKEPASDHPAIKFDDEEVMRMATDRDHKLTAPGPLDPVKAPWKDINEAITVFKTVRTNHIKYAKSTTEDLRDHFIPLAFGKVDAFQLILYMSGHCQRHTQQINEIRADARFPKK